MIEVIAEWGQSNMGDLPRAIKQAEIAHATGCAYTKYQVFQAERIAGAGARRYWDPALGGSDSQVATFKANGMLKAEEWRELKAMCDIIGVGFLATPFDLEAVDLLESIGVSAYKVASGDVTYRQLLQKIATTGKPVFLSTGAAYDHEIEPALVWLESCDVTLLACSLSYPCELKDAHLARITTLQGFAEKVGYSDHTLSPYTSFPAVAMGATVLEKHCTLGGYGVPDDRMAMNPQQLQTYVRWAQAGWEMRGSEEIAPCLNEWPARIGARRSLHAAKTILAGEVFEPGMFSYLRPTGDFEPAEEDKLFGKMASRLIEAGEQIQRDHIA